MGLFQWLTETFRRNVSLTLNRGNWAGNLEQKKEKIPNFKHPSRYDYHKTKLCFKILADAVFSEFNGYLFSE